MMLRLLQFLFDFRCKVDLPCRYLGLNVPRQAFDLKFGGYWQTISVFACVPLFLLANCLFVNAFNGWNLTTLVAGPISIIALSNLLVCDAATRCAPPKERAPV